MEKNKTIAMVITAAVAIIMVGSLLMPIINDAIDDSKVYYNNEYGPYAQVVDGESVTINISTTIGTAGTTTYTVNGESVIVPQGPRAILIAENLTVFQNYSNGIAINGVDSNGDLISSNANWSNASITIDGNTISYTATLDDATISKVVVNEWAFYRSNEGDYRIIDFVGSSVTVYVNDLTQVYGSNRIGTTGEFFRFNGTDVKISKSVDGVTTTRNATATVQTTDVMDDVISFKVDPSRETSSSFKFITDNNGEDYDVYPYYMIVPASVYGQTETNAAYAGVLAVLPILVICGIMVAVVATFRSKF